MNEYSHFALDECEVSRSQSAATIGQWRLLRCLRLPERFNDPTDGLIKRAVVVDVEATSLSTENDDVIQLAILPFDYEPESGRILNHAVHRRIGASFNDYGECAHLLLCQAPGGPPRNGASGLLVFLH